MGSVTNDSFEWARPQRSKESNHVNKLLPHVLDAIAAEDPDHIIGFIANPGTMPNLTFSSLSSSQMANAVNFTAHWLHRLLDKDPYETISFIGLQDYRYWIMTLAAIKTGHPLLLASPRNAIVNTASLLHAANCNVIFYTGRGSPLEAHVKALQNTVSGLRLYEVPSLEQMIAVKSGPYPYNKTYEQAKKDTVLFLHTSGSTGDPKPIRVNNAFMARMNADQLAPVPLGRVLCGTNLSRRKGLSYFGAPLFHSSGVGALAVVLCAMHTLVLGPVDQPLSGEVACAIVRSLKLNAINAVPFIHELIFGTHGDELKDHLIELDHINSFGGPLPPATRKWCADNLPNTALWQGYGMTENWVPLMLVPPSSHWHCIEFHPTLGPTMDHISPSSDSFEVVFRRHPDPKYAWLHPVFEIYPDLAEFRTGDLFHHCRDEGLENLWEFEGRVDDLMILSNGGKVNPLHIESKVASHTALKGSLMFGEGRTGCGMLLEPVQDDIAKEELLSSVWPAIEEANSLVPERARVLKSLIVVASAEKPMVRAAKGTLVRKQSLKLYEAEIKEAYNEAGIK